MAPPPTFDPRKGGDMTSSTTHFMLFEGLTKNTPESTHAPALAEKIDISNDGKTYTFEIRRAQWSNGEPITSYDFAQAWKTMLEPGFPSPSSNLLYPIKNAKEAKEGIVSLNDVGIECPDHRTLVVTLKNPTPYFLELTSFCALFPVPNEIAAKDPHWADTANPNFVCNGPFILDSYTIGDKIVMKKNYHYREADKVQIKKIDISLIDNENTAFELFEKKGLDILGMPFTNIPVDSIPDLKKRNLVKPYRVAATTSFFFNTHKFPFTNKEIRKAFALCINRQEIVDNITQLGEEIGTDFLPSIAKNGNIAKFINDDDFVTAKLHFEKGLEEIGITKNEFPEVTFLYAHNGVYQKIAQVLQQTWYEKLGVNVRLESIDFTTYIDRMYKRNYTFTLGKWIFQFNDIMNVLDRHKYAHEQPNFTGWEHPHYIALLDASMHAHSKEKRYELLRRAEEILYNEMPTVPLYHMNNPMLFNPLLKGIHISPTGTIHLESAYFL